MSALSVLVSSQFLGVCGCRAPRYDDLRTDKQHNHLDLIVFYSTPRKIHGVSLNLPLCGRYNILFQFVRSIFSFFQYVTELMIHSSMVSCPSISLFSFIAFSFSFSLSGTKPSGKQSSSYAKSLCVYASLWICGMCRG